VRHLAACRQLLIEPWRSFWQAGKIRPFLNAVHWNVRGSSGPTARRHTSPARPEMLPHDGHLDKRAIARVTHGLKGRHMIAQGNTLG